MISIRAAAVQENVLFYEAMQPEAGSFAMVYPSPGFSAPGDFSEGGLYLSCAPDMKKSMVRVLACT